MNLKGVPGLVIAAPEQRGGGGGGGRGGGAGSNGGGSDSDEEGESTGLKNISVSGYIKVGLITLLNLLHS
jgi:hypothetical protein